MARHTSAATGLVLDESDPEDAKILARQRAVAKASGKSGRSRAGTTRGRPDLEKAYDAGAAPAPAPPAAVPAGKPAAAGGPSLADVAKAVPTPTLKPPKSVTSKDMGGFALGLVIHALVVSYIRYGKAGPKGWLKAKFLNDPIEGKDLERENRGGSRHENPDSVPLEDLTPEERENLI